MNSTPIPAGSPRTWLAIFTCLCLSAGHGIILYFVVSQAHVIPSLAEMGGGETALWVSWFLISVPLAAVVLLFRGRILRMQKQGLVPFTLVVVGMTCTAFVRYLGIVSQG